MRLPTLVKADAAALLLDYCLLLTAYCLLLYALRSRRHPADGAAARASATTRPSWRARWRAPRPRDEFELVYPSSYPPVDLARRASDAAAEPAGARASSVGAARAALVGCWGCRATRRGAATSSSTARTTTCRCGAAPRHGAHRPRPLALRSTPRRTSAARVRRARRRLPLMARAADRRHHADRGGAARGLRASAASAPRRSSPCTRRRARASAAGVRARPRRVLRALGVGRRLPARGRHRRAAQEPARRSCAPSSRRARSGRASRPPARRRRQARVADASRSSRRSSARPSASASSSPATSRTRHCARSTPRAAPSSTPRSTRASACPFEAMACGAPVVAAHARARRDGRRRRAPRRADRRESSRALAPRTPRRRRRGPTPLGGGPPTRRAVLLGAHGAHDARCLRGGDAAGGREVKGTTSRQSSGNDQPRGDGNNEPRSGGSQ